MKKILIFLILFVLTIASVSAYRSIESIYTPKATMISQWNQICAQHSNVCYSYNIGKTILGKNIPIYIIGQKGQPTTLITTYIHGWEDAGSELLFLFANETMNTNLLANNRIIILPVINIDSTARTNARRTDLDGSKVCYGVDINRNFVSNWNLATSTLKCAKYPDDYKGYAPLSEPEAQAIDLAISTYRPKVFLDVHMGGSPRLTGFKKTTVSTKIINYYKNTSNFYPTSYEEKYATAASQGNKYNATSFSMEILPSAQIPDTKQELIKQYYAEFKKVMMAVTIGSN
jgi:hypothetical protein